MCFPFEFYEVHNFKLLKSFKLRIFSESEDHHFVSASKEAYVYLRLRQLTEFNSSLLTT